MRITRRTSGGRGEYEISEPTVGGVTPNDLVGRTIILELPNGQRLQTGTRLTAQGGKRRLRRTASDPQHMQIPRQLAAALLLPEPIRADEALGAGEPVIQRGRYAFDHIAVDEATLLEDGTAVLRVGTATLRNGSVSASELRIGERLSHLSTLWSAEGEFPPDLRELLRIHRRRVLSGELISKRTEDLVRDIQLLTSERSGDLGIIYSQQTDVLQALERSLTIETSEPIIQPDEVDPDEMEIRLRTVKEWKRWANARGPKTAKFRSEVRGAYRATCLVCGERFPPTHFSSPGVDAAHILPWSQYDLDEITNGLCLCKLHHWAFDEALIRLRHSVDRYFIELPEGIKRQLAASDPDFSVDALARYTGPVDLARLPERPDQWPRPDFIERLNESTSAY